MFKSLLATLLVLTLTSMNVDSVPSCCGLSKPVAAFSASLYTALAIMCSPQVPHSIEVTGQQAAASEYAIVYEITSRAGYKSAAQIAATASKVLARAKTVCVETYFAKAARNIGQFLEQNGALDCNNAIARSKEAHGFIRKCIRGMEASRFENYQQAVLQGMYKYAHSLGYDSEDNAWQLTEISVNDEQFP